MFALCFMFLGMFLGYLLRERRVSAWCCRLVMPCILALLFCMGVLIGSNDVIMDNLHGLGLLGAVLAIATLAGSVLAVWFMVRLFPYSLSGHHPSQPSGTPKQAEKQ